MAETQNDTPKTLAPADVSPDADNASKTDLKKATREGTVSPEGTALPVASLRGAGAELVQPKEDDAPDADPNRGLRIEMRAAEMPWLKRNGVAVGRPPALLGLLAKGDVTRGVMDLVDLKDGKIKRFPNGYVLEDDTVYANARNLPAAFQIGPVAGDALKERAK